MPTLRRDNEKCPKLKKKNVSMPTLKNDSSEQRKTMQSERVHCSSKDGRTIRVEGMSGCGSCTTTDAKSARLVPSVRMEEVTRRPPPAPSIRRPVTTEGPLIPEKAVSIPDFSPALSEVALVSSKAFVVMA